MIDYDRGKANQFLMEKQSIEVAMALDIQEVFNDELLPNLRSMCLVSIFKTDDLLGGSVQFRAQFIDKWKQYACFRGVPGWNVDAILQYAETWNASECGDWIRVYGEIVEQQNFFGKNENAVRSAYQTGPSGSWSKPKPSAEKGQSLNQPQLSPEKLRRRIEFELLMETHQDIYLGMSTPSKQLMNKMPHAGIAKWAIMAEDITGKMDQFFGLMPGATISGTTTDNIFFLEQFGRIVNDPIYYLLPLASIVAGGHHSLLEVALPLTLNNLINYSVGCYSTLMPVRQPRGQGDQGAEEIKKLLITYENRPESRLMLFYYNGVGRIDGCLVAEGYEERQLWVSEFLANEQLMREFMMMHDYPTKGQVEIFAMKHKLFIS